MARAPLALMALACLSTACMATSPRSGTPDEGADARSHGRDGLDRDGLDEDERARQALDEAWARYTEDLQGRLAARALKKVGQRGPFAAAGERFGGDCSGFVQAVYAAEGVPLRSLVASVAPDEPVGVFAAHATLRTYGEILGPEAPPAPGDLVFWHDTYDRNRNGRADDPFTHVGIVERVEAGTVHFLHRGSRGVARGVMTLRAPDQARDADGVLLNSRLRARAHPVKTGGLAGALFAGFGRLAPRRLPAGVLAPPSAAADPVDAGLGPSGAPGDDRRRATRG